MDNAYFLRVEGSLLKQLGIQAGQEYEVALGTARFKAAVKHDADIKKGTASIGRKVGHKLRLPVGLELNLTRQKQMLRIGPLVGILTGPVRWDRGGFGEQESYFRKLLGCLRTLHGFGYVFSHHDIDWERSLTRAYCFTAGRGGWQMRFLPFPDVVYNRYLSDRGKASTENMIERLRACGVRSFNTALGSKWDVYEHLKKYPELKDYLPETMVMDSPAVLSSMIERYGAVYIKTFDGHLGKNISRISRSKSAYLLKKTGEKSGRYYASIQAVYDELKLGLKLVQQGINTTGKDKHYDVRVLMQKDRHDQWHFTGAAARVSGSGMITTNLHTGGSAHSLAWVLAKKGFSSARIRQIFDELEYASFKTAAALEDRTEALADMGLDYVIDRTGKPWFLEANPRAGRRSFEKLDINIRRLAVRRPMEYALFLGGF